MRFRVFKDPATGMWRFTNFRGVGGFCETFDEAIAEASDLAFLARPMEATA